jgi:hypothetical protein
VTPAAADVIDDLLAVLVEERRAVRALDGGTVARLATRKRALAGELAALETATLIEHRAKLDALRGELRRNGVLLAHARACVREGIELLGLGRTRARL